jgi:hypothetical protein
MCMTLKDKVTSPTLIGLGGAAATVAYALTGIHAGPVLIVLPFGIGFDAPERIFYIAMGIIIVLVGLLSNYQGTMR